MVDQDRFDSFTRRLGATTSRRTALQSLAVGLAAAATGAFGLRREAEAVPCRKNRRTCSRGAQCCSGYCAPPDQTRRRRCACSPDTAECAANVCCADGCTCGGNDEAGQCVADFFQGFESDTSGWRSPITRVPSDTNGIASKTGGFHAEVGADAFTRFGGYVADFGNGFDASIAIYLDMAQNPAPTTDKRFDYTVAINQPSCDHRRDFIFNCGTDPAVAGRFACIATYNAPGWPTNPDPNWAPIFRTTVSGWYTLTHHFYNSSGQLCCDMTVSGPGGSQSWTRCGDPGDDIGVTVGGHRYGWFPVNQFPFLAIDDSSLTLA